MFNLGNQRFNYLVHLYNLPRISERTIEVPIAIRLLQQYPKALEVGAVTPHYHIHKHEVIDLYEEFPGVINADVLDYQPREESYDLVLSISTLDHLLNPEQVANAVERMKRWTSPNGFLFFTLPYGQATEGGPWLDEMITSNAFGMERVRFDKVRPERHEWEMVDDSEPLRDYGGLTRFANSVFLFFHPYCPFLVKDARQPFQHLISNAYSKP